MRNAKFVRGARKIPALVECFDVNICPGIRKGGPQRGELAVEVGGSHLLEANARFERR